VRADELPEGTDKVEGLTPDQARKLVKEFPGVELEIENKRSAQWTLSNCLPLKGLKSLDPDTAKALAGYDKGPLVLSGLTTLDADTARALAAIDTWNGQLPGLTAFESSDSIAIAKALATRKGSLSLPNLKRISPKTLSALITKEDVEIPLIEKLELIPESDGGGTEDFVIPKEFEERQKQKAR